MKVHRLPYTGGILTSYYTSKPSAAVKRATITLKMENDVICNVGGVELEQPCQREAITAIYHNNASRKQLDVFKAWLADTVITTGDHAVMEYGVGLAASRNYRL